MDFSGQYLNIVGVLKDVTNENLVILFISGNHTDQRPTCLCAKFVDTFMRPKQFVVNNYSLNYLNYRKKLNFFAIIAGHCYEKVKLETQEIQKEMEKTFKLDPIKDDIVVLYEDEEKYKSDKFWKVNFLIFLKIFFYVNLNLV